MLVRIVENMTLLSSSILSGDLDAVNIVLKVDVLAGSMDPSTFWLVEI